MPYGRTPYDRAFLWSNVVGGMAVTRLVGGGYGRYGAASRRPHRSSSLEMRWDEVVGKGCLVDNK